MKNKIRLMEKEHKKDNVATKNEYREISLTDANI